MQMSVPPPVLGQAAQQVTDGGPLDAAESLADPPDRYGRESAAEVDGG